MQPTYVELLSIRDSREEEKKRYELAVNLNICPTCGSKLIREDKEILDKPKKYFFGLIVQKYINWSYRLICSKDKSHYEDKHQSVSDDGWYC